MGGNYVDYSSDVGEITNSDLIPDILRGMIDFKYIQIDSKEFLYIFDYNWTSNSMSQVNLHLVRCEKDSSDDSLGIGQNYFKDDNVKHANVDLTELKIGFKENTVMRGL